MAEREVELKRNWKLLKSNVLKYARTENMLLYLTPQERRVLFYILTGKVKNIELYESVEELYEEFSKGEEIDCDESSFQAAKLMRDKLFQPDFMSTYPYYIYLDFREKFQTGLYQYTKLLYKAIYWDIREYDYNLLKPNYFYYEKFLEEHLFNRLRPDNTYFNLIFFQGLLTELKEEPNLLKGAECGLLRPILMENLYSCMVNLRRENEGFEYNALTKAYEDSTLQLIEEAEDKKDKIIARMKEDNRKTNQKLNLYEEKLKLYRENSNNSLINEIYLDIRRKDEEISELQKTEEILQEAGRKKEDEWQRKLQSLNKEKEVLAGKITELERVVAVLKERVLETEEERLFLQVKHYMEKFGMDKVAELLTQGEAATGKETDTKRDTDQNKKQEELNRIKLGYATLTADGIMVITPTGTYPVYNIPEKSLVGEGQFIRVDGKNNFINSYHYYTQYKVIFNTGLRFGEIQYLDGIPFINMVSCTKKARALSRDITEGQIVMADMSGNVRIFFKRMYFNLDYYYEIIHYYGMDLWRVVNLLEDVCVIEGLEKKEKVIYKIPDNIMVKQNDILLRREENLVNVLDFKFFSHSSYYDKRIRGTAEVHEDIFLLVKDSGEKVIVNNIPENLSIETGDILVVDEYGSFIRIEVETDDKNADMPRKKRSFRTGNKFKINQYNAEKKVLIVGNPSYHQSYLLNLLKKGYVVETVDGFQPFVRIMKESKKADIIVVMVNFISHDNMWLIKDNIKDIPIVYPDSDGAARILECLELYYQKENRIQGTEDVSDTISEYSDLDI